MALFLAVVTTTGANLTIKEPSAATPIPARNATQPAVSLTVNDRVQFDLVGGQAFVRARL